MGMELIWPNESLLLVHIVFVIVMVALDYFSTSRALEIARKYEGDEKAIKNEFSPIHKFFWRKLGIDAGIRISFVVEFAIFVLASLFFWIFFPKDITLYILCIIISSVFSVSLFNDMRYIQMKEKYEGKKPK